MASDFRVGRQVRLHLMPSDQGRWVGKGSSDVRSVFGLLLGYSHDFHFVSGLIQKLEKSQFLDSTFLFESSADQTCEKKYVMVHRSWQGVCYRNQNLTSDVRVGRQVGLHLMQSDQGRWVGKGSSGVRSVFGLLLGYSHDFHFVSGLLEKSKKNLLLDSTF